MTPEGESPPETMCLEVPARSPGPGGQHDLTSKTWMSRS